MKSSDVQRAIQLAQLIEKCKYCLQDTRPIDFQRNWKRVSKICLPEQVFEAAHKAAFKYYSDLLESYEQELKDL